ncbi:MAG: trypsin-like peptidase domain-containing protein [Acidobacteria bacterium]|nr:trypsin-like peptidase domain-containing protein [Acidobacteriota bacterium]
MSPTVASILVAAGLVSPLAAQTQTARVPVRVLAEFSDAIEELARKTSPAVVQLTVRTRTPVEGGDERRAGFLARQEVTGSGVVLDPAGYIVTNAHVVEGARGIDVSVIERAPAEGGEDHRHYPGKIVGVDRETDLAVLKIEAQNLPTLAFLDSEKLKQGQIVVALGSPLGLENSLTVGFVSAPVRHLRPDRPVFYIQTDAPINPGNSGGPLLDIDGRIAGINTMILSQSGGSEGIGLAIPSNLVQRVYRQIVAEGRVRRGAIGIIPEDITPTLAAALKLDRHTGVILSDVLPRGAAEAAGLAVGDILVAADGKPLRESRQLVSAIFQHAIGDEIRLDVERGGLRLPIAVTVMERPSSPAALAELANGEENLVRQLGILALTVDGTITASLKDLRRLYGVAVAAIPAEFAAFNPGLVAGDVIYELNGKRIASLDELRASLGGLKRGDPVALLVERQGQLVFVTFELE